MATQIIGIGGKARSGKDTVGRFLIKRHGFRQTAFAESLKEACKAIFHLGDEHLYGALKETRHEFWKTTPRDILQRVGTEALRRGFDEQVWIKSVEYRIKKNPNVSWVITDVRFPNEADVIKQWGGKVYLVTRPGIETAIATNQHASETSLDGYTGWDGVIENSKTIGHLYHTAREVMQLPKTRRGVLLDLLRRVA